MKEAEYRRLRWAYRRAILGATALNLVIGVAAVLVWFKWQQPGFLDRGQLFLILPLLLIWTILLRKFPLRVYQIRRDLISRRVETVIGAGVLHPKPGFRLFAPPRQEFTLDGLSFNVDGLSVSDLYLGKKVLVRYACHSDTLLSVQKLDTGKVRADTGVEFSEQEIAILRLMRDGQSDKLIARELGLNPTTIRTYNSNLYRKLSVTTRKAAVAQAWRLGLYDVN
ncbi:response regulator transcription factor [Pseudidiomarina sp.]|uniref:response regulator transcription factor n=1 Tax=Pseudidiomarina sp. TaxID=2081707 RepID=UPI00299D14A0|nr:LuxR C-terminal-related transcriptional regulator [Pseudidiomarina sp.]MDX1705665.1 LuxR C-terminal-related transcriptional regulator [Pseudidiomarina sp.]